AQDRVQVRLDDPIGLVEPAECLQPQGAGAVAALLIPEADQHQLEVCGLDRILGMPAREPLLWRHLGLSGRSQSDRSGLDLFKDLTDQLVLDLDQGALVRVFTVVLIDRTPDRLLATLVVERVESKAVVEQTGDAPRETV